MVSSDADLHMTALALELCCTMMDDQNRHRNVGAVVRDRVLPQALVLVRSSLLQGQALQASFVPNNFIIIFMWGIIADYMFLAVGKYGCVFELAGFANFFCIFGAVNKHKL